jgi:guanine deaminase
MDKFMKLAIAEAKKGILAKHGGPFGAVVVKDGLVIARGHNHVVINNDPTQHGEIDAIRKACKKLKTFDLTGCTLYSTAEPCPMCLGAILWANIGKVYYGCRVQDTEEIGFRDKRFYEIDGKTATEMIELDRQACLKIFDDYTHIEKIKY